MSELALYVTRIEGYGAEGSSFSEDQFVFSVESIDENLCKVVLHEPVSAGEWSSVSTAIQLALETIDKPMRREKIPDDADEERILTISEVYYRDIHLKSPSGFYNLPIVREDGWYVCRYEPWAIDACTEKLDDLWSEVNQAIAYSWKAFALEVDEKLSSPALLVKERLLADWTRVDIVRIKKGAHISQDHSFAHWPICYPPQSEYINGVNPYRAKDPDMLFAGDWNGKFWNCVAEGYGDTTKNGDYGSGSIFVFGYDGVEIVG